MTRQNKVSGVVLAGGMARRMQHKDKGLLPFKNQPLITYPLAAMAPLVDELLISANRNHVLYRQLGYPVITDLNSRFDGPLAGILAAMHAATNPILLIAPCDSPLIDTEHLRRLLGTLTKESADIAVAFDGKRLHPVLAALRTDLQTDLKAYLDRGERKLQKWFQSQGLATVNFSDTPEIFANINTPAELVELENRDIAP